MKNYLKFILSYLLIFVIIVSSFGITIHNHICGHSGKTYSSLFEDKSCECDHHKSIVVQEEENLPSCCATVPLSDNNSTNMSINQDSCCSDNSTTKSLELDFLTQNQFKLSPQISFINFIKEIENVFIKQKNDIECKFKSIKQKLKSFTSFSLKIITILNTYIQNDNPDDKQTA